MAPWICQAWIQTGKNKTHLCNAQNFGWRDECRKCNPLKGTKVSKPMQGAAPWHEKNVVRNGAPRVGKFYAEAAKLGMTVISKGKGKGKGESAAAVASAAAPPQALPGSHSSMEPAVDWASMTKQQKRKEAKRRKKAAKEQTQNDTAAAAKTPPQAQDAESGSSKIADGSEPPPENANASQESAVPRNFAIDLTRHFKKLSSPPQEKERPAPKDAVNSLLPKTTAESETALAKQQEIADLQAAIEQTTVDTVKKNLQSCMENLQKELQTIK